MERVLKNILNFYFLEKDGDFRNTFIGDITEYIYNHLKKTNKFKIPQNVGQLHLAIDNVDYSSECNSDFTKTFDLDIDHATLYMRHLMQVAHRAYHYAQCYSADESKRLRPELGLLCEAHQYDLLKNLFEDYANPGFAKAIQEKGKIEATKQFPLYSDVLIYIEYMSFCQSFEIEASNFSIDFIRHILKESKKYKLTEDEEAHIDILKPDKIAKAYDAVYKKAVEVCKNPQVKNLFIKSIGSLYTILLRSYPEAKSFMEQKKPLSAKSNSYAVIDLIIQMLEFSYDDERAKTVLNTLLKCPQTPQRDRLILLVSGRTQIKLTDGQKDKLAIVLRTTNLPARGASLADFLKEKTRVAKERQSIEQGTFAIPQAVKI